MDFSLFGLLSGVLIDSRLVDGAVGNMEAVRAAVRVVKKSMIMDTYPNKNVRDSQITTLVSGGCHEMLKILSATRA